MVVLYLLTARFSCTKLLLLFK